MGAFLLLKAAAAMITIAKMARKVTSRTSQNNAYRRAAAPTNAVPAPTTLLRYFTGGPS